ncbi:MAG: stage II sporulation protein M [Alicyclobacillus sp.]|nr:stage II sporulation protein M [Alicyclobacillus sp.]
MTRTWEDSQGWIWALTAVLLVGGCAAAILWPHHFTDLLAPTLRQLQTFAKQSDLLGSPWHASLVIFVHNLFAAAVVMMASGVITGGIYPAWALWMNGLAMGYVVAAGSRQLHAPEWQVLVYGMLPHGVFELPAFVWSAVIGIRLGRSVVLGIWRMVWGGVPVPRSDDSTFTRELTSALRQLPYVVGLLVVAAIIEGNVTPLVIRHVFGAG